MSVTTHTRMLRLFLIAEGASFLLASLVHRGLLVAGYDHAAAAIAETTIAVVLLAGAGLTWLWSARTPLIGVVAQAFAFLGTLVGVTTIAIGIGPRTAPDIAYHVTILAVLAWGLVVAFRSLGPGGQPAHRSTVGD